MRLTRAGKLLILLAAATAVVSVFAPHAGLGMAIVLAAVGLLALAEGVGSGSAQTGHDAWAGVRADRKREARQRHR